MKLPLHTPEKTQYRDLWQSNAAAFADQGCYAWMSEQLRPFSPRRILDIGCGTGEGLLALLEGLGKSIVSLEENFDCIRATESKLTGLGHEVTVIPRLGYLEGDDGRHNLVIVQDEEIAAGPAITLLHADPMLLECDTPLKRYFDTAERFDAVTVWLIGTYEMRRSCRTLDAFAINDAGVYRMHVQSGIYKLADRVLRPGGVLQIVDRGLTPDTDPLREIAFKWHRERGSGTSLNVSVLDFRPYEEPTGRRMSMTGLASENPAIQDDGRRAMHSMISIKP